MGLFLGPSPFPSTCSGSAKGPRGLGSTWGRGSGTLGSWEFLDLVTGHTFWPVLPRQGALTSINQFAGGQWLFQGPLGWEGKGKRPTP